MKKGVVCLSIIAISITVSSGFKSLGKTQHSFNIVATETTYTVGQFCDYLTDKKEHYPLSDEFIERYQQTSGGYIDYAKKCGIEVNKYNHSPNQKWHFFTSWVDQTLEEEPDFMSHDAKSRVYTKLLCPELLLWIYEAMGVDPNLVRNAKVVAEAGKVAGTAVSTIAKNMRAVVSWEDLTTEISKQS